jgi:hypothetical protein
MSKKIIVLSDNSTWEELSDDVTIAEATDEAFQKLCDGWEPNNLEKGDIIRISGIKEAN